MKKYCKHCTYTKSMTIFFGPLSYGEVCGHTSALKDYKKLVIENQGRISSEKAIGCITIKNIDNNCSYYKRKWWIFWA